MIDRKQHAHLVPEVIEYISKRLETKIGSCWIWTGTLNGVGHPRFNKFVLGMRTHMSPHIVMFNNLHSPDTPSNISYANGDEVRRECGEILCVNPEHMKRGTRSSTISSMITRGTTQTGNDNATIHSQELIVEDRRNGMSYRELMDKYNIKSKGTISYIVNKSKASKSE